MKQRTTEELVVEYVRAAADYGRWLDDGNPKQANRARFVAEDSVCAAVADAPVPDEDTVVNAPVVARRAFGGAAERGNLGRMLRDDDGAIGHRWAVVRFVGWPGKFVSSHPRFARVPCSLMAEARSTAQPRGTSASGAFVRSLFNFILTALSVGVAAMCVVNVFASSIEVDRLANQAACHGQPATCEAQYTMWERTPWGHTLQLSTPAGMKTVQCQREYLLVGAWSCAELGKVPAPTASVSAVPSVGPSSAPPRSVVPKAKPPGPGPMPSSPMATPTNALGSR